MNRQEKAQQVAELRDLLDGTQLAVLTDYSGLSVANMVELRSKLREAAGGYRVVKNTLAKRATEGTELEALAIHFKGPIGVAYSHEDAAGCAKTVSDFAKDHPKFEVQAGFLAGGTMLDAAGVHALAKLPGKDQLRAMLLSAMAGVPRSFLGVLSAAPRSFVGVLEARRRELAGEA